MTGGPHGAFPLTRHSIVAAVRSDDRHVRRSAFDALITAYWKPVFKFIFERHDLAEEDATCPT